MQPSPCCHVCYTVRFSLKIHFRLGRYRPDADEADVKVSGADVKVSRADVKASAADVKASGAEVKANRADVKASGADVWCFPLLLIR